MIRKISLYFALSCSLALAQESRIAPASDEQPADKPAAVFSPEPDYTCDRDQQLCWNQQQPAFHMTRIQFGVDAAMKLLKDTPQIVDLEGDIFYPEPNVSCDFAIKICYLDFQASAKLTEQYFNKAASERLADFLSLLEKDTELAVFDPMKGTRCARKSRICYDHNGPSVSLTRVFFGNDRANQLVGSLLKQQAAKN